MVRTKNTVTVQTDSRVFAWVDKGTRAHIIRPKQAGGVLVFHAGGKSRGGSLKKRNAGPLVFTKIVHHPGFKGRGYTKTEQAKVSKLGKQIFRAQIKAFTGTRNP
jgi:hypothetical protein